MTLSILQTRLHLYSAPTNWGTILPKERDPMLAAEKRKNNEMEFIHIIEKVRSSDLPSKGR